MKRLLKHLKKITKIEYLIAQPMRLLDWFLLKLIRYSGYVIYYPTWIWRNKSLRNGIMWLAILSLLIVEFFGLAVLIGLYTQAGRFMFAAMFMLLQFAALFFFLSSTKNIETIPGDKGLVNFKKDYFGNQYLVDAVRQSIGLMAQENKGKLDALGAEPIHGMLLTGPPGTGKSLLVQCLAYDIDAAFIGMSGTDFKAMFFGVAEMKVMRTASKAQNKADEYGSCVIPETLILTDDLRWVRANTLKTGDKILGFDELPTKSSGKRRLRIGTIEAAKPDIDELVTIITDKGEITVTKNHPFLAHTMRGAAGTLSWTNAADLKIGQTIKHLVEPWESETGDTWLAGMLDGEGDLSYGGKGAHSHDVGLTQVAGPILDRAKVLEIRPQPRGNIIRLQTDINTYIADGFISHNCLVFIDEIDSIGQSRGGVEGQQPQQGTTGGIMGAGSGVLSKLLTVMDGTKELHLRKQIENYIRKFFGYQEITQGQVIWLGATNRLNVLDPALIRPGRLDQIIQVDPPDRGSRRQIIKGYLNKIEHDDSIDIDRLTMDTQGVTPAQLANSIQRGAARFTIADKRTKISMNDIEEALQQDLVGLKNPIAEFDPLQKEQVATHEAGHALISHLLLPSKRVTTISIIRRGKGILGYMRDVSSVEVYSRPLEELFATIQVLWAGHVATDLLMNKPWSGASKDIEYIQNLKQVLAQHGQFAGQIPLDATQPWASRDIRIAADAYDKKAQIGTRKLLVEHKTTLEALRDALIDKDELNSQEVYAILEENKL